MKEKQQDTKTVEQIVGGRNIHLDILTKDSTEKHYNIEVQKKL